MFVKAGFMARYLIVYTCGKRTENTGIQRLRWRGPSTTVPVFQFFPRGLALWKINTGLKVWIYTFAPVVYILRTALVVGPVAVIITQQENHTCCTFVVCISEQELYEISSHPLVFVFHSKTMSCCIVQRKGMLSSLTLTPWSKGLSFQTSCLWVHFLQEQ